MYHGNDGEYIHYHRDKLGEEYKLEDVAPIGEYFIGVAIRGTCEVEGALNMARKHHRASSFLQTATDL